jgi:hypothetical protein
VTDPDTAGIDLFWIPLGAGEASPTVRTSGRAYEALVARREHRAKRDLYHSALEVRCEGQRFVIEMTPAWGSRQRDRGVVAEGPVGLPWLGRWRLFRYEVRCWRDGLIPDLAEAVGGPHRLSEDSARARCVLDMVSRFPTATWGLDELRAGEMWNSNSLVAWLLAKSGLDTGTIGPPGNGRAPGWSAGLVVAARDRVPPVRRFTPAAR